RRFSHCWRCRRRGGANRDKDRHYAFVAVGAADHLYGVGLPAGRIASPDPGGCVKLLYFAWVRERLGKAEERLDPPASVATVDELMTLLAGGDEQYDHPFEN